MGIKNVVVAGVFLEVIVLSAGIDSLQCQEKTLVGSKKTVSEKPEYPAISADIPEKVYQVAEEGYEKHWLSAARKGGSSLRSVSSDTTVNVGNIVLSEKPVKYSMLYSYNLLQCESGDDILSKASFRHYFFHVLNRGKTVGVVGVNKNDKNNEWKIGIFGKAGGGYNRFISKLREKYPESDGYQTEILGLVFHPSCYWVTLVTNRARGEYWITTNDKRFSDYFNFPEFIDGKRNIVPLETMLPKLLQKVEKIEKTNRKKQ